MSELHLYSCGLDDTALNKLGDLLMDRSRKLKLLDIRANNPGGVQTVNRLSRFCKGAGFKR